MAFPAHPWCHDVLPCKNSRIPNLPSFKSHCHTSWWRCNPQGFQMAWQPHLPCLGRDCGYGPFLLKQVTKAVLLWSGVAHEFFQIKVLCSSWELLRYGLRVPTIYEYLLRYKIYKPLHDIYWPPSAGSYSLFHNLTSTNIRIYLWWTLTWRVAIALQISFLAVEPSKSGAAVVFCQEHILSKGRSFGGLQYRVYVLVLYEFK